MAAGLLGVPRAAQEREAFEGVLQIESYGDHRVSELGLAGPGWDVKLYAVGTSSLGKGEILAVPFTAIPQDPNVPLRLTWLCDGEPMEQVVDLSPEGRRKALPGMSVHVAPGETGAKDVEGEAQWQLLEMLQEHTTPELLARTGDGTAGSGGKGYTITVTGEISYAYTGGGGDPDFTDASYVRVAVFAEYPTPFATLEEAAVGWTDEQGGFEIDLYWPHDGFDPDIQVVYYAWNEAALVKKSLVGLDPWSIAGPLYSAYPGTTLDVGWIYPSGEPGNQALHLAETIRRAREFWTWQFGIDLQLVDCFFVWQYDGTAHYSPDNQVIAIFANSAWSQHIHAHEYGHYVNHVLPMHWVSGFTYCNSGDYCDDPDCGHCLNCNENWEVAFMEGWAQLASRITTDYIEVNYDHPARVAAINIETINPCLRDSIPQPQDPEIIEGFFAAALYDLIDTQNEDWDFAPGYKDVMDGYLMEVVDNFQTTCSHYGRWPHSPREVLHCFMLNHPELREPAWETFRNSGYDIDYENPDVPTILVSYPPVNTPTPDYTIQVNWEEPEDDLSGVNRYAFEWSQGAPVDPGVYPNLGDVTTITSGPLNPGDWYFSIRAIDAADNYSDYAWIGPIVIIEAEPPDLEPYTPVGWDAPLVVRDTPDASSANVHYSLGLEGGTATTYWNIAGMNTGELATLATSGLLILDGTTVLDTIDIPVRGAGVGFTRLNVGPITVPPGRHSLTLWLDSDEVMSEPDELDNYWCGQWVWRAPAPLATDDVQEHPAPPGTYEGWDYYQGSGEWYLNCAGHRIEDYGYYQGVWLYTRYVAVNYDLKLFDNHSTIDDGFDTALAISSRPAGCLDAVLAFGLNAGILNDYNLGVINFTYDMTGWADADYRVSRFKDAILSPNSGLIESDLWSTRFVEVYTFSFTGESNGYMTFRLKPKDEYDMHLSYFDENFTVGGLLDAAQTVTAYNGMEVYMNVYAPVNSVCAMAVWRDPIGATAVHHYYDLEYYITRPDPLAYDPVFGLGPLVPASSGFLTPPYSAPDELIGNADATYLRFAEMNDSPAACAAHEVQVNLDGELLDLLTPDNAMGPDGQAFYAAPSSYMLPGYNVPGGRHSLTMVIDPSDAVTEIKEYNNDGGYQWVWSPEPLGWQTTLQRPVPADAMGGRGELTAGWAGYNCLGLRATELQANGDRFVVFYVGAEDSVDVDLRLHEPSTGPQDGFTTTVAHSLLGFGEPEYIVMDPALALRDSLDVGISCLDKRGNYCWIELAGSDNSAYIGTTGYHGAQRLDGMLNVHQLDLPDGLYRVTLTDYDSRVDLGLSAHVLEAGFSNRSEIGEDAQSWQSPGGQDEQIWVRVEGDQDVALVVWRPRPEHDYQEWTNYAISISSDQSEIEGQSPPPPRVTRLIGGRPNPLSPGATIRFDIAAPERIDLSIYDMRGRLVKRLLHEPRQPGRYAVVWDGVDAGGRPVPAGIYFCRIATDSIDETKKVTLIR
jgi:hypothetical protein